VEDQNEYSILEAELRQSLVRGYFRLRQSQAQGKKWSEAERIIELLGDPQLLSVQHPRHKWKLQIPLVYVSAWTLQPNQRVKSSVQSLPSSDILTLYKRRQRQNVYEPDHIHDKLVEALRIYVQESDLKGGLLLDYLWAPRPEEADYDEVTSENWFALHDENLRPHWFFGGIGLEELPNQVWKTNGLIRLTFPLYRARTNSPYRMITIVLGLAVIPSDKHAWSENERKRIMRWIRRLANTIVADVKHLYSILERRRGVERIHLAPPEWLKDTKRDALHIAVDDLHRKIIEFAERIGSPNWNEASNGFNFLIAFKELDENYKACLRYRLSIPNLHAFGAKMETVDSWRSQFEVKLKENEEALHELFLRSYADSGNGENRCKQYLRQSRHAIDTIFNGAADLDVVKTRVMEMVESTSYHMRLTPGYFVMNLGHPEIIQSWLHDPRAKKFDEYPSSLLTWESTALPKQIYYSQIADGALSIGICGVNAEILEKCPSYYELQEIIDESGPRFRYIVCEEEFQQLEEELKEDLKMLKGRSRLWTSALRRFRRLAYYHFQNPWDYHTKLVYDRHISQFDTRPWIKHRDSSWQELGGLSRPDARFLIDPIHIPTKEGWRNEKQIARRSNENTDFYETDFLKAYLENYLSEDWAETRPDLTGARLHKIKMRGASDPESGDTSLLVLIPDQQNNQFAKELISRFVNQCELAFEDYEKSMRWNETYRPAFPDDSKIAPYDVFLCYNSEDRAAVKAIGQHLKEQNIKPWLDEWEIRPGLTWLDALQEQLENIKSAAVFIGQNGIGPWQRKEVNTLLGILGSQDRPLIPVLLLGGDKPENVPLFLQAHQWVDFNKTQPDPIEQLKWGITGQR